MVKTHHGEITHHTSLLWFVKHIMVNYSVT